MISSSFPDGIGTATRLRQWRRRSQTTLLTRWLAPSLASTVRLSPRSGNAEAPASGDLRATLTHFQGTMRRAWLVAVARRAVLCGLVIAVVLTVLVGAIGWSRWLGPVIGAAVAAGVTGAIARRAPGVPETARFLDRTLDLKEQLATAVELEGTASSMLATQLQEHARSSVQTVAETWGTRTSAATREWAALALLLCALAVAAVIPLGTAGTAQQRATSAGGGNLQAVPAVPTASAADTRSLAVQVAVVRTQAGNAAPTALGSTAPHAASPATARQQAAQHRTAVTRSRSTPGAGSHTGTSSSGQKSKSNVTASSGHTLPLLKHSENFLPTSPGAKGQKGSFYSSTQPKPGTSGSTGTRSGSGGAASRAPGSPSGAKGTAQRSQSGQQAGSRIPAAPKQATRPSVRCSTHAPGSTPHN